MIRELATEGGSQSLVILSMLLFITVFVVVVARLWRLDDRELHAMARLPLADDDGRDVDDRQSKSS